jgi:Ala-tRNA(Pro) deacylase
MRIRRRVMSALERVRALLDEEGLSYEVVKHREEFTAREEADASGLPPTQWAKSLAVLLDGRPALAVLPADRRLDLDELREVAGAGKAELVGEDALADLYPDCDVGALPPFGRLYGQPTYVDTFLRKVDRVGFHAGTHTEALLMDYPEFERVAEPVVGWFGREVEA